MKDPMERAANGQRSAHVLAAINDKGQTAKEIALVAGMLPESVRKPIARLCSEGQVFKAKFSSMLVWYFKTEAAAKAFTCPVRLPKESGFSPPKVQTGFVRGAHVHTPAHVKVQKCPGFNGLGFAADPEPAAGGFKSLGVGRYLEETAG